MFIVGMISWWYSAGWTMQARRVKERIVAIVDFFSISLLLKTLFSPFRQISAGRVNGPIAVRWHAFVDQLVSRCIGAIVRLFMILFGLIAIMFTVLVGAITLVVWLLVPLLPLVGLILTFIGWVPAWG